jgi:hypothetical protein
MITHISISQCLKKPIFNAILSQEVGTQQFLHFCIDMSGGDQDIGHIWSPYYITILLFCVRKTFEFGLCFLFTQKSLRMGGRSGRYINHRHE